MQSGTARLLYAALVHMWHIAPDDPTRVAPTHMSHSSLRTRQLQPCLPAVPSEPWNKEIKACCSEESFATLVCAQQTCGGH